MTVAKWENTTTKSAPIHHLASHVNQTRTTTNEVNLTSLLVYPAVPMLNVKTACANLVLTTLPVAPLAFLAADKVRGGRVALELGTLQGGAGDLTFLQYNFST